MSSTETARSEIRRSFSHARRTSCTSVDEQRVGTTYRALVEWRFPANSPFDLGGFQLTVEPPSPRSLSGGGSCRRVSFPSSTDTSESDRVSFISDPSLTNGQSFGLTYFARNNVPLARISAQLDVHQFGLSRDAGEFSLYSEQELVESIADELVAETRAQLVDPQASLGDADSDEALVAALRDSGNSSSVDGQGAPKALVVRDPEAFAENVKQRVQSRRAEAGQVVAPRGDPPPPKKRIPLETMTREQRAELDAKLTAFLLFYVVNSPSGPL